MKSSINKSKGIFKIYGWKMILPFLGFILPYVLAFFFFSVAGHKIDGVVVPITYRDALYMSIESVFALFVSFVLVLFSTLLIITKKTNFDQNELMETLVNKTDSIKKDVDHYLDKAKIVFESGINEYDDTHLLAIRRILSALEEDSQSTINIYAIDNSEPRTWWSDTMTGYLALLANWKSQDTVGKRRSVFRIFVCQKNELLSPVFIKTIGLHSLMGFKTYVITVEQFNQIYSDFSKENSDDLHVNKEVLIWLTADISEDGKINETPKEVSFNLDKYGEAKKWNSVKCYQSFWDIGSDYNMRTELINKSIIQEIPNYYKHNINSKKIEIWFEFIAKEKNGSSSAYTSNKIDKWNKIPEAYKLLIHKIIDKMVCCKDANEVKQISLSFPFGIEIKTSSCADCIKKCDNETANRSTNFDFTSSKEIQNMLQEYYLKLS